MQGQGDVPLATKSKTSSTTKSLAACTEPLKDGVLMVDPQPAVYHVQKIGPVKCREVPRGRQ